MIVFEPRQNDILGDLLNILSDFLSNRKQLVVLNGQTSSWAIISAGFPQGSSVISIYVNDLPDGSPSIDKLFADDTSPSSVVHNISATAK